MQVFVNLLTNVAKASDVAGRVDVITHAAPGGEVSSVGETRKRRDRRGGRFAVVLRAFATKLLSTRSRTIP